MAAMFEIGDPVVDKHGIPAAVMAVTSCIGADGDGVPVYACVAGNKWFTRRESDLLRWHQRKSQQDQALFGSGGDDGRAADLPDRLADLASLERIVGELNAVVGRLRTSGVVVEFGGRPSASDPLCQEAVINVRYRVDCERAG